MFTAETHRLLQCCVVAASIKSALAGLYFCSGSCHWCWPTRSGDSGGGYWLIRKFASAAETMGDWRCSQRN